MSGFGLARRPSPKAAHHHQPPAKSPPKPVVQTPQLPHQPQRITVPLSQRHAPASEPKLDQTLKAKKVDRHKSDGAGPTNRKLDASLGEGGTESLTGYGDGAEQANHGPEPRKSTPLPTVAQPKAGRSVGKGSAAPPPVMESMPSPDSGAVMLPREPLLPVQTVAGFRMPGDPEFEARTQAGGKTEPVIPEKARAITLFREAVASSSRLYASFVEDARHALADARLSESGLDAQGRIDLEAGLAKLAESLRQSRQQLDSAADFAVALIERSARQTRRAIDRAARSGYGTLNSARRSADSVFDKHDKSRTEVGKTADGKVSSIKAVGENAALAIRRLTETREADNKDADEPMRSAINEAINLRLPPRIEPSAKAYTEEAGLECSKLTQDFTEMKTGLVTQFELIKSEMEQIKTSSAASITFARDGAYAQLTSTADQLQANVSETRARGHTALIKQYNLLRRQLIAAHRDRAHVESEAAQLRATRGTGSALAAANGQQVAAQSLADNLAREKTRPSADFAKIIASSATAMTRHVATIGEEQRGRARRGVKAGEEGAKRQSEVTGRRLATSAEESGAQLIAAGENAANALTEQIEAAVTQFDEMPAPVRQALDSALPRAKAGYATQNAKAADKIRLANETITASMAAESNGNGGAQANSDATKQPKEKPNEFLVRAGNIRDDPKSERSIAELAKLAGREVPSKIRGKVGPLYDALKAFSTNVESVLMRLRGLTALQGAALKVEYNQDGRPDLARHIRKELWKTFSTARTNRLNINAALNYLNGNNVAAALAELKSTVNWSNDEGRAEKVLRSLTPTQLAELNKNNPEAMKAISKDLDGTDKAIFDSLNKIKSVDGLDGKAREDQEAINLAALGEANAHRLKKSIDDAREKRGESGGDLVVDRISEARLSIGDDVLSGGDAVSAAFEDPDAVKSRQDKLWNATEKGFEKVVTKLPDGKPNDAVADGKNPLSAITRYATAPRKYEAFVPNETKGSARRGRSRGGRYVTKTDILDAKQIRLVEDIVRHGPNSEEAAASTIEFELSRKSGKPKEDRLRKALLGDDLLAAREGESDALRSQRLDDIKDSSGNVIHQGDRSAVETRRKNILAKVAERRASEAATTDGTPPKIMSASEVEAAITDRLEERFASDPTAKAYTKSMISSPTFEADPSTAFDFALAHEEKNKETLAATLGRMNRSEIRTAVEKWDKASPKRAPLYKQLGLYGDRSGKLDGDARNDTELAFRGVPRNDMERALNAAFVVEQQRRDSGAVGRTLAGSDYERMVAKQAKVLEHLGISRDDIDATGDIKLHGKDGKPIKGKFDESGALNLSPGDRDDFEAALQFSHMNAESYKQAVDRISTGVVMGLMVLAAVVTTFVTFGGAAAIWGPILITAGAGLVGMGLTAAIRGDRYTKAEIQRDLVMTFVQAATAGLGAWAGAGARGAGTAARGAQAAAKGAANTEKLAAQIAATAGKQSLSKGAKALNFGKEVVVGGATNSINSAFGAAMDPENRRLGKSGEKALDAGFNAFMGGALGAALTKPISALGRPLGAGGQRIMGNVGSGFTSRLTEARLHHVAGEAHESWAESLETAKEGIAQDAIQAFGEHHADNAARSRYIKKRKAALLASARQDGAGTLASSHPAGGATTAPSVDGAHAAVTESPHLTEPLTRAAIVNDALPSELKPSVEAAAAPEIEGRSKAVDAEPATPPFMPQIVDDNGPQKSVDDLPRHGGGEEAVARTIKADNDDGPATPGIEPILARSALQNSGMLEMGRIPEHSVFVHPDPGDLMAANDNFGSLILHDPTREVAHVYNLDTGESIVIQGNEHRVGTINAEGKQSGTGVPLVYGWTKLMNGKAKGRWIIRSHYHPNDPGSTTASLSNRLPTGVKGDFNVLLNEMKGHGLTSRSSRIYYIDNGHFNYTDFGIDAHSKNGRYWFDYPDSATGKRKREEFASLREYHTFVGHVTGKHYPVPTYFSEPDLTPKPSSVDSEGGAHSVTSGAKPKSGVTGHSDAPVRTNGIDGDPSLAPVATSSENSSPVASIDTSLPLRGLQRGQPIKILTPADIADLHAVAGHVKAGATTDAHALVASMGLVGETDAMARLHNVINNAAIDVPTRKIIADVVLDATRQHMLANGQLDPGEQLHLLFHGAPKDRTASIKAKGIDSDKLTHGPEEDFSGGLYTTKQLENALLYARRFAGKEGDVFPYIIKHSELGTIVDILPNGTHRTLWENFVMANLDQYGSVVPAGDYDIDMDLSKTGFGSVDGFGDRGVVFDMFLTSLGGKLAKPDIVFGELGGLFTSGDGEGDQQAIKSAELAAKLNKQRGIVRSGDNNDIVPHKIDDVSTASPEADASTAPVGPKPKTSRQRKVATTASDTITDSVSDVALGSAQQSPKAPKAPTTARRRRAPKPDASTGDAVSASSVVVPTGDAGRTRRSKQSDTVLDSDAAMLRARDVDIQKQKQVELANDIAIAQAIVADRARMRPGEAGQAPPPTAQSAAIIAKMQTALQLQVGKAGRKVTQEDRLEALREILTDEAALLDGETRRRLEWVLRNLEKTVAVANAETLVAQAADRQAEAETKVRIAEEAKREANRSIKNHMRKTGKNYRSIKRNAKFDAILGKERFDQLQASAAGRGGKPIAISPDHLVSLDEIANMPALLPLFDIHQQASPGLKAEIVASLQALGDLPDNLVPMRSDANEHLKNARSWHDIDPKEAARYGYSADDVSKMRDRETAMRGAILKHIDALIKTFKAKHTTEVAVHRHATSVGIDAEKLNTVLVTPKGSRPDPKSYLPTSRINEHAKAFANGAARFTLQSTFDKYGLGQSDGTTFILPKDEADRLMSAAAGDLRKLEVALGLPVGQLDSATLLRADLAPKALDELNFRIPSGNEAGANSQWLPGGLLQTGVNEAVIDGKQATPGQYVITEIK